MALALCCAGAASAATVAPRSAVVGAADVAGLTVEQAPASAWLHLVGRHAGSGARASTTLVRSAGSPKLLIVSRALVARDGIHASAAKRALRSVSPARGNAVDARALGVRVSALRKAQRIVWRDGPVMGEIVAVGVAKGDGLVGRLQDLVRARVRRTLGQSAWDALQARVAGRGGRADAATAVQAFALAVAPLPGVRVPKGPKGSIPEGTLAISWMLANYGGLTPGVRQAFDKAVRRAFGLSGHPAAAGAKLDAIKAQAIAFVAQKAGVDFTLPVSIVRGYPASGRGAAALGVDAAGKYRSSQPAARCVISVRGNASRTLIAHEVFHCLQVQLAGRADALPSLDSGRAWLGEGSASYAGCLFSQDGAAPYRKAYATYVEQPLTPLGSRAYDAVGFFAHLDASGAGALSSVGRAMAAPSLIGAAFPASGEGAPDILDSWASSLYRLPALGSQWDVAGACAPPKSAAAQPTPIVLGAGKSVTLAAPAYAAHPYVLLAGDSSADAIKVQTASGHVRIGAAGVDARPSGDAVFCLGNATWGVNPAVAVTGGPTGAKVTMSAVSAAAACGPGGSATCSAKLCLPFGGASSTPLPPGPLSPIPQGGNPIPAENAKQGTPISQWDISGSSFPDGADNLQGFTDDISYNVGDTARFKISAGDSYRMDIYRMGYYQGNGARLITTISGLPANNQPSCNAASTTGEVTCPWSVAATWQIPADAVSGIYFAKLTGADNGQSHVFFIVRNDASRSDIYYQTSDTTWQAYNQFGGTSLYTGMPGTDPNRAYKVSYDRPFNTRGVSQGQDFVFNAEYPMVRWMERNGYDVSYETGVDTDRFGSLIRNHRLFMSSGHDEYWSGQQRTNVESARDAGVNLAFFSGNEMFWKTRWEDNHRTLVSYKTTHNPGNPSAVDPTGVWTGSWRDPNGGARPENEVTGQFFTVNNGTTNIQVPPQYHSLPIWRNTSVASASGTVSLGTETLGYEWDSDKVSELPAAARPPSFTQPQNMTELSSTTFGAPEVIQDMGHTYAPRTVTHNLTLYRAPSGAQVFGAGTIQWAWGLDPEHDRDAVPADPSMQQATINLLSDMGVDPATLQPGMMPG